MASDTAAEPDAVDAAVPPHAETPDAAAVGRHLDDDELDERRSAKDEDERGPPLLLRPAPGDPVADQMEAMHTRGA
jgi:hypothetical protein